MEPSLLNTDLSLATGLTVLLPAIAAIATIAALLAGYFWYNKPGPTLEFLQQ